MGIIALEREDWEWPGFKAHNLQDRVQFDLRSAVGKTRPPAADPPEAGKRKRRAPLKLKGAAAG
jgi:hypothetical protein